VETNQVKLNYSFDPRNLTLYFREENKYDTKVKNVPIFNYFSYLFLISSLALDSTIALDMQVTDRVSEFAI